MVVCPVCENAQVHGGECEVCGKRLGTALAPAPPVAPLDGLEPTVVGHGDPFALAAPDPSPFALAAPDPSPFAEIEPTRLPGADAALAAAADAALAAALEPTRAPDVEVAVEATPDLERLDAPVEAPTAAPLTPTCRYCRTPALPGEKLCGRCGMRLPVFEPAAAPAPAAEVRLCSCGAPVRSARCPACGARHAVASQA